MQIRRRLTMTLLCCAAILPALPGFAGLVDFSDGLLNYMVGRFGYGARSRLLGWQGLVRQQRAGEAADLRQMALRSTDGAAELPVLRHDNDFFNRVPYYEDIDHWGVADYWATPAEMLASNGGDCEDYAIAKYLTLKDLGLPVEKMRITYVKSHTLNVAHMVLAYYPTSDADPWILDNIDGTIRRASERSDLEPIFSFNDDDLWFGQTPNGQPGGAGQVRLWHELRDKLEREKRM